MVLILNFFPLNILKYLDSFSKIVALSAKTEIRETTNRTDFDVFLLFSFSRIFFKVGDILNVE